MKLLAFISVFAVLLISINNNSFASWNKNCFEFPILILLSLVGVSLLISANDLMLVYLGLELLSLSSYVLVALNRDNALSSEAAIKYFILGALASGLILFGSSLVYGFAGDTNLTVVFDRLTELDSAENALGLILGMVLVFSGFIFKISAAPMHMWAPDVYQGVSKPVLAYLSTAPKVAALAFLIRIISSNPDYLQNSYTIIIIVISALSLTVGSFAGIKQTNIKRLLAYSSIANMGFILIAVSVATKTAMVAAIFYLTVYIVTVVGLFAIILNINKNDEDEDKISNLSGLSKTNPYLAFSLAVLMFSVAGIPPLAGFFAKFYVFIEAIKAESYAISIIGVVASVVACFYYLRIIKTMYFDDAGKVQYVSKITKSSKFVIFSSVLFSLVLIFYVNDIVSSVKSAVSTLY
jgi:NADH-quinone oxidoreductase subunit N